MQTRKKVSRLVGLGDHPLGMQDIEQRTEKLELRILLIWIISDRLPDESFEMFDNRLVQRSLEELNHESELWIHDKNTRIKVFINALKEILHITQSHHDLKCNTSGDC